MSHSASKVGYGPPACTHQEPSSILQRGARHCEDQQARASKGCMLLSAVAAPHLRPPPALRSQAGQRRCVFVWQAPGGCRQVCAAGRKVRGRWGEGSASHRPKACQPAGQRRAATATATATAVAAAAAWRRRTRSARASGRPLLCASFIQHCTHRKWSGLVLLGRQEVPRPTAQATSTSAGERPCFSAMAHRVGSCGSAAGRGVVLG